uniref:CBS domain-containing protein n=1 Tax=Manihot esculenta TaxID=3983 RepID=A0A2C9UW31_MANES
MGPKIIWVSLAWAFLIGIKGSPSDVGLPINISRTSKILGVRAPYAFIETLRDRMFKPALSTIIGEQAKVAIASLSDPVCVAAKKMSELRVNSIIIATGNKIQGILTSKDILMRVVAQNLSPELTLVEKVMTPNPECATLETPILDALHIMHDGKFLHLPVMDKDGSIAACVDVLQITHAAISMVNSISNTAAYENDVYFLQWIKASNFPRCNNRSSTIERFRFYGLL